MGPMRVLLARWKPKAERSVSGFAASMRQSADSPGTARLPVCFRAISVSKVKRGLAKSDDRNR